MFKEKRRHMSPNKIVTCSTETLKKGNDPKMIVMSLLRKDNIIFKVLNNQINIVSKLNK